MLSAIILILIIVWIKGESIADRNVKHTVPFPCSHFLEEHPYTPASGHVPEPNGLIFVSIASYRDPEILETVRSLVTQADQPHKLVVCVNVQDTPKNVRAYRRALSRLPVKLNYLGMSHKKAMGPVWARYLIQREWRGEEFYLQIDSHMRFVPKWDTLLKTYLPHKTKACISLYVPRYSLDTGRTEARVKGAMEIAGVDPTDGFLRFRCSSYTSHDTLTPSHGWAGCFSFSSSNIILDAPYDPYLPYLFFGEETDIYVRLLARGWKFFVPSSVNICYTTFRRDYRKTFWEHPHQKMVETLSRARLYHRLGMTSWTVDPRLLVDADKYTAPLLRQEKLMVEEPRGPS